ncbi:MAG: SpoIIE family protein phosphatase, partial [Lachnospiraceae bacterium]|nr:SpoIIE family protein phosphatase [Lachnospiraceae bacterium]
EGNVIADGKLDPDAEHTYNIFDNDYETVLKPVGRRILEQKDGILRTGEGDDAIYIAYATIDSTNWKLCLMSPVSTVIAPAQNIRDSIDGNTANVVASVVQGVLNVLQNVLVLTAVLLLMITLTAGYFSRKISNPLKKLTADVEEITGGNFQRRTEVDTDDEIGELARSFNSMTDSLQKYIADLKEATAKEERIVGELAAATNIQASMLPRNFEEFSNRKEFDLYAIMDPAKEVGGDFYDYFMVDDDHVALVMADVSGKGVPAALFMVIAKTLIKNHVQSGESPAEALTHVNEQLCENNESQFFVTVWLAVIELSTGKGVAANAGHEHPTLKRADGSFELVTYRHSPAVATMEGIRFKQHEFELHPGDRLFVYTDGVPEATNASDELMGTDRMLEALNRDADVSPKQLLSAVSDQIDTFVGEAPQFDDITMLGFYYHGNV